MQEISVHQFQTQGGGGVVIHRSKRVGMVMMQLLQFHLDTNWPPVKWQKQPILPARFLPISSGFLSTVVPSQPTLQLRLPPSSPSERPAPLFIGKWTLSLLSSQPLLPLKDDTYHFNYLLRRMDLLISEISQCDKRSSLLRAVHVGLCEREPWENAPCS